jgi:internalin A
MEPVDMKPAENPDLVVTIPDLNLEIVIRTEVGKPDGPITAGDMAQIIDLSAPNSGIQKLDGIEYCVNLLGLNMASGQEEDAVQNFISDLSPIAGLVALERLSLQGNRIHDLSPLTNLISLRAVNLSDNGLEDISTLGKLINLEDLLLINNKVGDISALANCKMLKNIWVQHNKITDLGSLKGLENLEKVFIDNNLIRDLAPLVENPGIGERDQVFAALNPLSEEAVNVQMKALRDRGVFVTWVE